MQAERTRYTVAGWGEGELWTLGNVVLAHDFRFHPVSDTGASATRLQENADMGKLVATRSGVTRSPASSSCGAIDTKSERLPLDTDQCLTPRGPGDPEELVERLTAFLRGRPVRLDDVPLDLGSGTAFQRAVATNLRSIPRGEVVTYGELAALAGHPGAQRAVGTFCARNRFMFLLPCHRVVAADGIGAYGASGVAVKRRLLALEGVTL